MKQDISDSDIRWMAGIVDAEGSISMSKVRVRRRKHWTGCVRRHRMRIKTTDSVIVPYICHITGSKLVPVQGGYANTVTFCGSALRDLLPRLIPHLYVKRKQAEMCRQAISIKEGASTVYSNAETLAWDMLAAQVCDMNKRGYGTSQGVATDHYFSWEWMAGIVDGDGSICCARWGRTLKPFMKISLTHTACIDYLCDQLSVSRPNQAVDRRGNRRSSKTLRLMSRQLLTVLPHLIPHLKLKQEQAQLALGVVQRRLSFDSGANVADPWVIDAMAKISELNARTRCGDAQARLTRRLTNRGAKS